MKTIIELFKIYLKAERTPRGWKPLPPIFKHHGVY